MEKIFAKKALGQNFLVDGSVLARIVDVAGIESHDRVLEVGPGRGALTRLLAARAGRVLAVEIDRQLVPLLRREFAHSDNVSIVEHDILRADLALLLPPGEEQWKVVANLPYNISSQVLFLFLDHRHFFSRLILMLQREVGERLTADPGCKAYGILTVLCRLHYDISRQFIVRPGSFHPVPKVDSIVLKFDSLPAPRCDVGDEAFFRRLVKAAFGQRRKTLWNCLKASALGMDDRDVQEALSNSGIDGGRRGETLSLEEYALLSRELLRFRKE